IEIGGYNHLQNLIKRDYPTFSGIMLERYFREKAIESQAYTLIGNWWDRKGENEMDMIAANEFDKTATIYEIKRNRKNINFSALEEKGRKMLETFPVFNGYSIDYKGLDMEDM
ncbi:MAG: DUF234 domain-containing protein, partial [Muribaculaceae bacterium]|nr:DUF234 domain-containing protein [Muribaculaceae bacterium]